MVEILNYPDASESGVAIAVDEVKDAIEATQASDGDAVASKSALAGGEVRETPPTLLTDGEQGSLTITSLRRLLTAAFNDSLDADDVNVVAPASALPLAPVTNLDAITNADGDTDGTAVSGKYTDMTVYINCSAYTSGTITVTVEASPDNTKWYELIHYDYNDTDDDVLFDIPYCSYLRTRVDFSTGSGVGTVSTVIEGKGA